ncbi:MAG: alpha/beta hydrolase [Nitrosomonadales bacterium]|nr:alpha/beta hydrolase [Nitrosomonadales bacterium]
MPSQKKTILAGPVGQIEGMLHLPDEAPHAIAVVAHPLPTMGGTMDNKVVTTLARTFVESGFAVLRFNFRGVGESSGSYDHGNGESLDAAAAAEFMRIEFPGLPLLCAGFSFGGYVQARAAESVRPQRMVLVAPAVGRFEMPHVPDNTLLVHGDLDEVVGLDAMLHWARPQHLPVMVLAGADHFFHGRLTQLKKVVSQHLKGAA